MIWEGGYNSRRVNELGLVAYFSARLFRFGHLGCVTEGNKLILQQQ